MSAAGMNIVYLHGFGSSPASAKARALQQLLGSDCHHFQVPVLDGGEFFHLTMPAIAERALSAITQAAVHGPVLLIGSSLGGYVAAWLAAQGALPQVCAQVLIAPAFGFPSRWRERLGEDGVAEWRRNGQRLFWHYGAEAELPLGVQFLESCTELTDVPAATTLGTSIVHGREDESVDWRGSYQYAENAAAVDLHLVNGDHSLSLPRHEALIAWCVRDRWQRSATAGSAAPG